MRIFWNSRSAWLFAIALALASALGACGGASDRGHGEGFVRAVDPVANRITIEHGDIPGMMKAMRMDFAVADPALLEGIAPGDEIEFDLREEGGVYTVTGIERVEMEGTPAE